MLRRHLRVNAGALRRSFASLSAGATASHAWEPIEAKWQKRWALEAQSALPLVQDASSKETCKETFYCLAMFPYPSGQLHIGHVRVYTISDCMSRLKRMQGFQVLHPMGWDAFGLPAENAAIERGISPADWTAANIAQAKKQLISLGIRLDWDREVTTCAPDYYKWTQWLFVRMFDKGLAYRKEAMVNWDPIDKTVLANEQVDAEGRSWRSGAIVEQRSLKQWFLRITEYGDRLLDDLEKLPKWPEAIKRMQSSWIGRSKGSSVTFEAVLEDKDLKIPLTVFTTRVDTIFGVSFVSVAPEAAIVDELLQHVPDARRQAVAEYIARVKAMTKDERAKGDTIEGVFTGLYARHPLSGKQVPLYLAEYVLPQYGTGVVMGVPAHDSRDFAFAHHHELPIEQVLVPSADAKSPSPSGPTGAEDLFTDYGVLQNSGAFSGMTSATAMEKINAQLTAHGIGGPVTQFRLRDWLVSRQRYWGAPVPVIHCRKCGPVGVPTSDLPVCLPEVGADVSDDLRGGDGKSPLARMSDWKNCRCPRCGGDAERDTDTLDTFVDSSWYFVRYCDALNESEPFAAEEAKRWLKSSGVDLYVGGIEHAILHLLYSRFVTKFLHDQHLLETDEPFAQLLAQGMVLGKTYKAPGSKRPLKPSEYSIDAEGRVVETKSGDVVAPVWEKMSKSKYNGVDPEAIRSRHGADVTRLAVLFKAPPAHDLEWDEADLAGQSRWLMRVWMLIDGAIAAAGAPTPEEEEQQQALQLEVHGAIKRVTDALNENQAFNVAIAELMKLSNLLGERRSLSHTREFHNALDALVKMLAPLAPHSASEMFERLVEAGISANEAPPTDVHAAAWPAYDPEVLARAQVKIVLQVQGKPRDTIFVGADEQADRERVLALALASPAVQRHLQGKAVRKAILIAPKKQGAHGLLNIVAS